MSSSPTTNNLPSTKVGQNNHVDDTPTRAAARGALLSTLLRLLSFTLTQLTIRFVDPAALGRASIRLELLLSTTLFVGREGYRLALTRKSDDDGESEGREKKEKKSAEGAKDGKATDRDESDSTTTKTEAAEERDRINNVKWLSIPTGIIASTIALILHLYTSTSSDDIDYQIAGIFYCISSLIESLAEPLVITCLQTLDVTTRVESEGLATLVKAMTTVLLLNGKFLSRWEIEREWPVCAFGVSQLVYAVVYTWSIYRRKWSTIRLPRRVVSSSLQSSGIMNPYQETNKTTSSKSISILQQNFDLSTISLTLIFTLQGLFKHALTEGDRIILTTLSDSYNQGVYAMASSYGGIVVRVLLQPLEENGRLLFSRLNALLLTQQQQNSKSTKSGKNDESSALLNEMEHSYTTLLKLVLYIGLLFASLATNYTSLLLQILAGSKWNTSNNEASATLSAFCIYTALLALNGTSEAFVYGVAGDGKQITKLGIAHGLVGIMFAVIAPVMVNRWGTVGLVYANGLAMVMRSWYSLYFAGRYFATMSIRNYEGNGSSTGGSEKNTGSTTATTLKTMTRLIRKSSPHLIVLVAFGATYGITHWSNQRFMSANEQRFSRDWLIAASSHVGVGLLCLCVVALLVIRLEKEFGNSLRSMVRKKKVE